MKIAPWVQSVTFLFLERQKLIFLKAQLLNTLLALHPLSNPTVCGVYVKPVAVGAVTVAQGQRCGWRGLWSPFTSVSLLGAVGAGARVWLRSVAPLRGAEVPCHEVLPFSGQGKPCAARCEQVGPPLWMGWVCTFPFTRNCLKTKSWGPVEAAFLKVPVSPRSFTNMETHLALLTGTCKETYVCGKFVLTEGWSLLDGPAELPLELGPPARGSFLPFSTCKPPLLGYLGS